MNTHKLLTHLSSSSPPPTYRKITLYVPTRLGLLFRRAAAKDGFRLVDFARFLVMLGLTATLISLNEAWLASARKRALLRQPGMVSRRPYAVRNVGGSGVWVAVCLPVGVLAMVDRYAHSSDLGRNGALHSCLQLGLATYLKGKRTFLNSIVAKAEGPSTT